MIIKPIVNKHVRTYIHMNKRKKVGLLYCNAAEVGRLRLNFRT